MGGAAGPPGSGRALREAPSVREVCRGGRASSLAVGTSWGPEPCSPLQDCPPRSSQPWAGARSPTPRVLTTGCGVTGRTQLGPFAGPGECESMGVGPRGPNPWKASIQLGEGHSSPRSKLKNHLEFQVVKTSWAPSQGWFSTNPPLTDSPAPIRGAVSIIAIPPAPCVSAPATPCKPAEGPKEGRVQGCPVSQEVPGEMGLD